MLAGHCAPGYEAVLECFRANFADRQEVGASVCVTHRGRTVVDLWGGIAVLKTGAPWTRDTISIVFSCTKGAAALCAHMLIEQKALGLYDDVAKLWPAFAAPRQAGHDGCQHAGAHLAGAAFARSDTRRRLFTISIT
ncbi:MAG: serine hydrolase domain-containing protein [Rhodospirillales bacterium]